MTQAAGETVQVLAVHVVGVWRWKGIPSDLQCVICDNPFELPCAQCDAPGDACPPAFGACGHIFHLHCIETTICNFRSPCALFPAGAWLNRDGVRSEDQGTCPMCRQLWQYAAQQPRCVVLENAENSQISGQHSQGEEEDDEEHLAVYAQPGQMQVDSHQDRLSHS
ncbi:hypothetical protein Efla_004289 [Eimeria flavescens]